MRHLHRVAPGPWACRPGPVTGPRILKLALTSAPPSALHAARLHGIHADVVSGEFAGQALRQRIDAALGGIVVVVDAPQVGVGCTHAGR